MMRVSQYECKCVSKGNKFICDNVLCTYVWMCRGNYICYTEIHVDIIFNRDVTFM